MLLGWKSETRSVFLISAMPMVPLLIPLFQNSTFSPNPKYMASLYHLQRSLVLLIPSQPNLLLNALKCYCLRSLVRIINLSLDSGYFPRAWKRALVRPLLVKKDDLDLVFKNYRPVSNLADVSKPVETAVVKQLQHYLFTNDLFPAYRPDHSTETALLRVTNDNLLNMNNQRDMLPSFCY